MNQITKTQLMELVVQRRVHESFEHSINGVFDVTLMREQARRLNTEIVLFSIADALTFVQEQRVTDEERILNLEEESWRNDPAMAIHFEDDNQHLLIDGSHRILRRHREGLTDFLCYLVPSREIIRPDPREWARGSEMGIDWGAPIVDGVIMKGDK
jgi:hypothetical protein